MRSYVTFDSLDAGRAWHTKPPGIGMISELDCLPPGADTGLGQVPVDDDGILPHVKAARRRLVRALGVDWPRGKMQPWHFGDGITGTGPPGSGWNAIEILVSDDRRWDGIANKIPRSFDGVPVVVRRSGPIVAHGAADGLGLFETLTAAVVAPVVGAAFQAGGAIGAALISADASKYAVRQQTKADLQIALARAKADLEMTKATTEAQVEISRETTKQRTVEVEGTTQQTREVSSGLVPVVGILGAGALVAWILLKD